MTKICQLPQAQSQACYMDVTELLINENSFIAPSSGIQTNPPHNGNFLISVYNTLSPGVPVVQYGAGTYLDPSQGHYPADSNSTYPLVPTPGGDYFVVVQTDDGIFNCGCIPIEDWDMCQKSVQINYEGPTNVSSFIYNLPVNSTQDEIDYSFVSQTIPDEFIIRYEGNIIFSSGSISTGSTPSNGTFPFTYNSDDFVEIEVIPDPTQPAGTTTIFSLSVGCCTIEDNAQPLPYRDAFLYQIVYNPDNCSLRYFLTFPYLQNNLWRALRADCAVGPDWVYDAEDMPCLTNGCVNAEVVTTNWLLRLQEGCLPRDIGYSTCISLGPNPSGAPIRTITDVGTCGFEITFPDTASYELFRDGMQAIEDTMQAHEDTWTAFNGYQHCVYRGNWYNSNVICGADGQTLPRVDYQYQLNVFSSDDAAEKITFDFCNIKTDIGEGDCCTVLVQDPNSMRNQWRNFFNGEVARFDSIRLQSTPSLRPIGATPQELPNGLTKVVFGEMGIIDHPCDHFNDPREYVLLFDRADPTSSWELYRGDPDTGGVLIQEAGIPVGVYGELPVYNGNTGLLCNGGGFGIVNSDGLIIQESAPAGPVIGDPGCQTLDLSYYGGSSSYTWVDGPTLVADLSNLPSMQALGTTLHWYPVLSMVASEVRSFNFQHLPCS